MFRPQLPSSIKEQIAKTTTRLREEEEEAKERAVGEYWQIEIQREKQHQEYRQREKKRRERVNNERNQFFEEQQRIRDQEFETARDTFFQALKKSKEAHIQRKNTRKEKEKQERQQAKKLEEERINSEKLRNYERLIKARLVIQQRRKEREDDLWNQYQLLQQNEREFFKKIITRVQDAKKEKLNRIEPNESNRSDPSSITTQGGSVLPTHDIFTCSCQKSLCNFCSCTIKECAEEDHREVCSKAVIDCISGCGEKLIRNNQSKHFEFECKNWVLSCPSCPKQLPRFKLHSHFKKHHSSDLNPSLNCLLKCGTKEKFASENDSLRHYSASCNQWLISCVGCQKSVPRSEYSDHLLGHFSEVVVDKEFCDLGCGEEFSLDEKWRHYEHHCEKWIVECPDCKKRLPRKSLQKCIESHPSELEQERDDQIQCVLDCNATYTKETCWKHFLHCPKWELSECSLLPTHRSPEETYKIKCQSIKRIDYYNHIDTAHFVDAGSWNFFFPKFFNNSKNPTNPEIIVDDECLITSLPSDPFNLIIRSLVRFDFWVPFLFSYYSQSKSIRASLWGKSTIYNNRGELETLFLNGFPDFASPFFLSCTCKGLNSYLRSFESLRICFFWIQELIFLYKPNCVVCGESFDAYGEYLEHFLKKCSAYFVCCGVGGCEVEVKREDMEDHLMNYHCGVRMKVLPSCGELDDKETEKYLTMTESLE